PQIQQFLEISEQGETAYDGGRIERPANTPNAAAWRVGLQLNVAGKFVKGGRPITKTPGARTVYDPGLSGLGEFIDILEALFSALAAELQEAVGSAGVTPCNFKLRMKSKVTSTGESGRYTVDALAEGDLRLDEGGAFQGTFSGSSTTNWDTGCRLVSGTTQGSVAVAGSYEDSDGTLR